MLQQLPDLRSRIGTWVPIWAQHGEVGSALQIVSLKAQRAQRLRQSERFREVKYTPRGALGSQRPTDPVHLFRGCRRVERDCMRQDHCMRLRMRKIERTAQGVA